MSYLCSFDIIDYYFVLLSAVSQIYSIDLESKITKQYLVSKLCAYDFIIEVMFQHYVTLSQLLNFPPNFYVNAMNDVYGLV